MIIMRTITMFGLAEGEAEEHGVPGHIRRKDVSQPHVAHGIHTASYTGEQE
jgi:hypothetical protein